MSYSNSIESEMKKFYKSLSEKDKRRYAAIEAQKLGWGGISYVFCNFWDAVETPSSRE